MDILEKKSNEKNIRYFFLHLYIYIGINLLFIIINLFVGSSAFTWVAFIWGLGIIIHVIIVFLKSNIMNFKLLEKEMKSINNIVGIKEGVPKREIKEAQLSEKKSIPIEEWIPEKNLIEQLEKEAKTKLKGIKKWIYFNIIASIVSNYVFLIIMFFITLYHEKVFFRDFYLFAFIFLFAFSSIVLLFLLVLKGFELRQKYSLLMFKILLTLPLLEFLILPAVGVADISSPGSLGEILVYCMGIIPPSIIFIVRLIVNFSFWPKLRNPIIVRYFNSNFKGKKLKYSAKGIFLLLALFLANSIIIFFLGFILI